MQFYLKSRLTSKAAILVLLTLSLLSCKNKSGTATGEKTQTADSLAAGQPDFRLGSFTGPFGDNKITILVSVINGDTVKGRSVVGGNDRPFSGMISKEESRWHFHAAEPGDHPDDGVFDLYLDPGLPGLLTGNWKANDKTRPAKTFSLVRKEFRYDTTVGEYPQASARLLVPEDVENMMKEDLNYMRNEIYARHGYCFSRRSMRDLFETEGWYIPNSADIRNALTDTEKKNIALIKRYEKYAEEYGDEYGR